MQYCTIALEQWRKVWSIAVLHFIVVIIGSEYCSIAVLERGLQYCIGARFGVAVSSDQREPMLPSRRPLQQITILCANYPLQCAFSHLLHKVLVPVVQIYCIIVDQRTGSALAALSHPSRHSGISHTRSSVMPAKPGLP